MTTQHLLPPPEPQQPQEGRRVWGPWETVGFGLVIGTAFFVAQVIVAVAFVFLAPGSSSPSGASALLDAVMAREGLLVSLASIASAIVGVGITAVVIKVRKGTSFAEYLGLKRPTGKSVLASLGVVVGVILLTDVVTDLIGKPLDSQFTVDVYRTAVWPVLWWPALVVFAPAFEEMFFRGFLFEGLRHSRIGMAGTILVTALAWSALHVQYGFAQIAVIFAWGIALGIVRWRTGSLWNTLIMHAFINLVATVEVATGLYKLGS